MKYLYRRDVSTDPVREEEVNLHCYALVEHEDGEIHVMIQCNDGSVLNPVLLDLKMLEAIRRKT